MVCNSYIKNICFVLSFLLVKYFINSDIANNEFFDFMNNNLTEI